MSKQRLITIEFVADPDATPDEISGCAAFFREAHRRKRITTRTRDRIIHAITARENCEVSFLATDGEPFTELVLDMIDGIKERELAAANP